MLKLVIFDMDGLMIDTERLYFEIYCDVFNKNGLEFDAATHRALLGISSNMTVDVLRDKYPDENLLREMIAEIDDIFFQRISDGKIPTKPGLFELFAEIEKRGIKKTVATSATKKVAMEILMATGIIAHLEKGAFSDMVPRGKPYPDLFLKSCEQFAVRPAECLVLEDSIAGVKAAINAGIPVIHIPDLVKPDEALASQCLAVCESLFEVVDYLKSQYF
jgi:HAD superfamily hydrolase (TIGR01509 family)